MIYIIVLLYTIYLVYKYDFQSSVKDIKIHYNILLLISILLGGVSYRLGIDTIRYEISFNELNVNMAYSIEDFLLSGNEPIWYHVNKYIKSIGIGFWGVKLIVLGFVNYVVFWFVRKYSPAFFFSILLYFVYFYFAFNFQILREVLAVAFVLLGLDCVLSRRKKGYILFLLWMIPACLSHHFAFVAIIVPLACHLRNGKWYVFAVISIFLVLPYLELLLSDLSMLDENLSQRVETYLSSEDQGFKDGISVELLLKNLIVGVFPIYMCTLYCNSTKNKGFFIGMTLAYIIVSVVSLTSIGIVYRLRNYFAIPMIVAMGDAFKNMYNKEKIIQLLPILKSRVIIIFIILLLIVSPIYKLFKSPLWRMYIPYSSILFEEKNSERESLYRLMGI